ncbi:hypothetical protein EUGRSUZ_E02961 [Eucalyptus grandis]|uniref:Uncharacterized protein n=2 Tax=Eucalyptus grandis TaxID=71139 RepID=A0ACC3JGP7_EUCGR|nr:hypothetical protein EUGRSUZ_E02961 [Eucalyptus grandis]
MPSRTRISSQQSNAVLTPSLNFPLLVQLDRSLKVIEPKVPMPLSRITERSPAKRGSTSQEWHLPLLPLHFIVYEELFRPIFTSFFIKVTSNNRHNQLQH